jgi:ParB family transcriptional regulator, chromosome partitioning protein
MEDKRLGRGLRSLLSTTTNLAEEGGANEVAVGDLRPNKLQPRQAISEEGVRSLSESIRKHGMLQPIVVRRTGGSYEIVAGERRWRAAKLAGMERVPVRVIQGSGDEQALEVALVENIQREDLDPISRARAMRQLIDVFGLTQERVALVVGMDRSSVSNTIRLLELPSEVQEFVSRGTLSSGHARSILPVGDPSRMVGLAKLVIERGLSVRQTESLVRDAAPGPKKRVEGRKVGHPTEPWERELEGRLREALGCRATLEQSGAAWRIVIHCADRGELDRVATRLVK